MILMGSLISEHLILKPNIGREQIKSLAVIDMIYGISAGLVLISGLLRWFVYGKGVDYYLHNPLFHTKLTLFVVVGILSIFPTVRFLKWRKEVKAGTNPEIDQKTVKKLLIFIRIELLIVALIPLLAVMIARGYGV
jgi:putative membrane protein